MYTIYAGSLCIYNDVNLLDELKIITPTLTMADSAAGSLEITVPTTNVGYDIIQRMKTEIIVKQNGIEIWSGRVLKEGINFLKHRTLYCEGELAYLNDTTQPQAEYHDVTIQSFLESLIGIHNSKVNIEKQFTIGIVTVTDPNNSIFRYTNYEKTIECINDKLLKKFGGHIRIRKVNGIRYLDYLEDYPNTNTQTIEFGKNLLDFTQNKDMSEYATVIQPLGARLDTSPIEALDAYLTVESVNNGKRFVVSTDAVNEYGWIEKVVSWNDVETADALLTKATKYLTDIQFDNIILEVSAVDFNCINIETESIKLLDEMRVLSKPHGMDRYFPVSKIVLQLDKPSNTKFTMGTSEVISLTSANNKTNSDLLSKIESLPKRFELLKDAKDNATQLITSATNGFVTIVQGQNGSRELLITNDIDYTVATKVWRWNINGLAYSSTGYNGTYGLAMTMDGSIVADRITTGVLNANLMKAGIIRSVNGDSYWDLVTGEVNFVAYSQAIKDNTDAIGLIRENLDDFSVATLATLDSLQSQVDGSITTWFYAVIPTNNNTPAVDWNTTDLKNIHLGDLYYDTITGYGYRYQVVNSVYDWQIITDTDITKALTAAADAQDTADSKRRVFINTPTVPYDVGDLWTQGASGDLMRCSVTKVIGMSYLLSDWIKASKYTDDTAVDNLHIGGRNLIIGSSSATVTDKWTSEGWDGSIACNNSIERIYSLQALNGWRTHMYTLDSSYANKTVTISFYAKLTSIDTTSTNLNSLTFNNDSASSFTAIPFDIEGNTGTDTLPVKDVWLFFKKTTTLNSIARVGFMVACQPENQGFITTWLIKDLKVETGDKATDWTPAPEDVTANTDTLKFKFTNIIGCDVTNNIVTNLVVGGGWGNAGVSNTYKFYNGDSIEFRFFDRLEVMVGLSTNDVDQHYMSEQYAIYHVADSLYIFESAINIKQIVNNWLETDILAIQITDNKVNYFRNGSLVYTSATTPVLPMVLDIAIQQAGAKCSVQYGMENSFKVYSDAIKFTADNATTAISDISSDSKLTPSEKQTIRKEWDNIYNTYLTDSHQADVFGIVSEKTNYSNNMYYIAVYLNGNVDFNFFTTIPSWISDANLSTTTDIDGTEFRYKFVTFYEARQLLLNAISTKAKILADNAQYNVDNLKIGGRNLLSDSGFELGNWKPAAENYAYSGNKYPGNNSDKSYAISKIADGDSYAIFRIGVRPVGHYILSFDIKCDIPNGVMSGNIFVRASDYTVTYQMLHMSTIPMAWTRIIYQFDVLEEHSMGLELILRPLESVNYGSVLYDNFKLENGTKATDWSPAPEDIDIIKFSFTNIVGGTMDGNKFTKTIDSGWGSAGISNTYKFYNGDSLEFKLISGSQVMCGLSINDIDQNYETIGFALYVDISGTLSVYELGQGRYTIADTWLYTDVFAVKISENKIYYLRNGTVFYTSTVTPTLPLVLDTAMYQVNSEVSINYGMVDSLKAYTEGKTTANSIVSTINQTAEAIKISADKLDLTGLVTIANIGTAGKTIINGSNIKSGAIQSANYSVTSPFTGSRLDLSNGSFDSAYFKWNQQGYFTASGGTIGLWSVDPSSGGLIYNNTSKGVVGGQKFIEMNLGSSVNHGEYNINTTFTPYEASFGRYYPNGKGAIEFAFRDYTEMTADGIFLWHNGTSMNDPSVDASIMVQQYSGHGGITTGICFNSPTTIRFNNNIDVGGASIWGANVEVAGALIAPNVVCKSGLTAYYNESQAVYISGSQFLVLSIKGHEMGWW